MLLVSNHSSTWDLSIFKLMKTIPFPEVHDLFRHAIPDIFLGHAQHPGHLKPPRNATSALSSTGCLALWS
jgi:hypothetical protein